jgi:hypothetical protein
MLVRLDDMRGDIEQVVEVTAAEWGTLTSAAGVSVESTEIDGSNINGRVAEALRDSLFDREEQNREAAHVIWLP